MEQQTPVAPAPALAAEPSAPVAPNSLAEFRAQKADSFAALAEPPVETPAPQNEPPIAADLEPPMVDEGDDDQPPQAATPDQQLESAKGPQQDPKTWRWKDPDTGMTLDLRRRPDRRMKRLLEERADLARQVSTLRQSPQPAAPEPRREAPRALSATDSNDPEPQLEDFADQPDPYAAHMRATARWDARQEFKQQQTAHANVERTRQVRATIDHAQQAFDAELPQVRQRYADFDDAHTEVLETVGRLPMQARAPLVHRLLTSPVKHDLTHYLGSHPDDLAAVVSARSAYEQGLVLGAIETRVRALVNQRSAAPAPHITPAPAPMAPVAGGASPVTVPDAKSINSLAQFRALKPKFGMRA